MNYYWTLESWGSDYPPENADEIIEKANALLDACAAAHPTYGDDELADYSSTLWSTYCRTGTLPDVEE